MLFCLLKITMNEIIPDLYIGNYVQWRGKRLWRNGRELYRLTAGPAQETVLQAYKTAGLSYPKFFKMDLLSKAAFVAAALTVPEPVQENKDHIATVISTASGCLDVDLKFEESRQQLASPALFVYTLPNIMLGELCIRHGFKGEQICTVCETPDLSWLQFCISDLLAHRGTEACLCGHVEATADGLEATLLWVGKHATPETLPFGRNSLHQVFNPLQP